MCSPIAPWIVLIITDDICTSYKIHSNTDVLTDSTVDGTIEDGFSLERGGRGTRMFHY